MYPVLSHFSHIRLFVTPWTIGRQAPLSMGFPRQEYCSGLPLPSPADLAKPGVEPESLGSPESSGRIFATSATCSFLWPSGALHVPGDPVKKEERYRVSRRTQSRNVAGPQEGIRTVFGPLGLTSLRTAASASQPRELKGGCLQPPIRTVWF